MGYGFGESWQSETDDPKNANESSLNYILLKFSF